MTLGCPRGAACRGLGAASRMAWWPSRHGPGPCSSCPHHVGGPARQILALGPKPNMAQMCFSEGGSEAGGERHLLAPTPDRSGRSHLCGLLSCLRVRNMKGGGSCGQERAEPSSCSRPASPPPRLVIVFLEREGKTRICRRFFYFYFYFLPLMWWGVGMACFYFLLLFIPRCFGGGRQCLSSGRRCVGGGVLSERNGTSRCYTPTSRRCGDLEDSAAWG